MRAYYDYMVDMAVLFGAERTRAVNELRESLQFEIDLANVSMEYYALTFSFSLYTRIFI